MTDIEVTEVEVDELPDCDIHRHVFGVSVKATHDTALKANGAGAFLCDKCLPKWGIGSSTKLVLRYN